MASSRRRRRRRCCRRCRCVVSSRSPRSHRHECARTHSLTENAPNGADFTNWQLQTDFRHANPHYNSSNISIAAAAAASQTVRQARTRSNSPSSHSTQHSKELRACDNYACNLFYYVSDVPDVAHRRSNVTISAGLFADARDSNVKRHNLHLVRRQIVKLAATRWPHDDTHA